MKRCTKCRENLPLTAFAINRSKPGGLSYECRQCHREIRKSYYLRHKKHEIRRVAQYRDVTSDLINQMRRPCVVCGESEKVCIDFHHLDPSKKDFAIGSIVRTGLSRQKILSEIRKCVCLCANCHRKVHAGLVLVATRLASNQ